MAYSVLQKQPDLPTLDQLKVAFRQVPGLTEMDAFTFGRDAFGILVKGFDLERATTLQQALASQGVTVEVVDEATLPKLPDSFALGRLDCTEKALLVYDSIGRVAEVNWNDIALIAAGMVVMSEFKTIKTELNHSVERGVRMIQDIRESSTHQKHGVFGMAAAMVSQDVKGLDTRTHEQRQERFILEIVLAGMVTRYVIKSDRILPVLFQYLGDRRTPDIQQNFILMVQDLIKYSPNASLNSGAQYVRDNQPGFVYPGKVGFYNEMVWLLWQRSLAEQAGD